MNNIAVNLKQLRTDKGWTQQDMADRLFVTRQAVSNWENGKTEPDADTLIKIADVLDVDVSNIFYSKAGIDIEPAARQKKAVDKTLVLYIVLFAASLLIRIVYINIDNSLQYTGVVSDVLRLKLDLYWKLSRILLPAYAVSIGLTEFTATATAVRIIKEKFTFNNSAVRKISAVIHYILLFFVVLHFVSMFIGWVNNPWFIDASQFINSSLPEPVRKAKTFLQYSALFQHRRWHFAVIGTVYELSGTIKNITKNLPVSNCN